MWTPVKRGQFDIASLDRIAPRRAASARGQNRALEAKRMYAAESAAVGGRVARQATMQAPVASTSFVQSFAVFCAAAREASRSFQLFWFCFVTDARP
jgi:hypothetical protein